VALRFCVPEAIAIVAHKPRSDSLSPARLGSTFVHARRRRAVPWSPIARQSANPIKFCFRASESPTGQTAELKGFILCLKQPSSAYRAMWLGKLVGLLSVPGRPPAHTSRVIARPQLLSPALGPFHKERMMPIFLFWAVPAAMVVGGIYLIAIAKVVDAALALFRLRCRRSGGRISR
jgi:hypothetical protein